jgi:hypothetical protein
MRKSGKLWGAVAAAGLAALVSTQPLAAQSTGASLKGRATDEQGGALPGVSITAKSTATGLTRTIPTGPDGSYSFASLFADTYDVTATLAGFKTVEEKSVILNVATTRTLNFTMPVAAASAVVTVTAEAPLVRAEPSIGAVVSQKELQTLPLNGRQFANLAVLAPGTTLGYNDDPTKPGQLQVQLNAGSGRNVNYVIDGGDNTDDTIGGALQNFSLESVQEFHIQTQQYKAEYGRSTGGVLNVVTRTGSNDIHGSAFEYFRDKSLNSETESEKLGGSGKSDYRRDQYGASIGGPIVKDKAHFFGTFERTDRKTNFTEGPDVAAIYPNLAGAVVSIPFKDTLVAAKVTADISASQFLQVRFGYQKNSDKYGAAPTNTPDDLGTVANKYTSILGGHQAQISAKALNEFLFQYSKFDNTIAPDSTNPTIYFPNGVISGQNFNTPQSTHQTKYQFKDDFSYSADIGGQTHDFKFGINVIHEPNLSGDFSTGLSPQFTVSENSVTAPVTNITQNGGFFGQSTPVNQYSVYLQDDWRPNRRLTVNAGIRYDLWLGFDLDQHSNLIWQELSTQTKYNENYLQDFQNGGGGKLSNDHKNVGPRLGFSWDATGQGKTFVHGGWGIYYDFPYVNATILFPAGAVQSNYGVAFQSFPAVDGCVRNADGTCFQIGQPLPPNALSGGGAFPPNEVASPTLKTPFSRQASIGISTQAADWLGVSLDLVNIGYRDIPYRFKANPVDPATGARRFPDLGNFRLWYGKGFADYNAINLSFNARVSQKLLMQGFYTYGNARGNVLAGADEFRLTRATFQPDLVGGTRKDVSVNPLDPQCSFCAGPLATDAHHRVTLGATYSGPWGIGVSAVGRYVSALPYMIYDSTIDSTTNRDGFTIDLPPGVGHVNEGRGHSFTQFDLRVSKDFAIAGTFGIEILAEVFNLFNATNPAGFRGDISNAATFGTPTKYAGDPLQGEQRLLQIGARVHF